ncbi:hypothetical protein MMC12_008506 [Toensbergia leucococca]|nr:hypothetical protein [Toensbergia leucococca]
MKLRVFAFVCALLSASCPAVVNSKSTSIPPSDLVPYTSIPGPTGSAVLSAFPAKSTNATAIADPLNEKITPVSALGQKGEAYLGSLEQAYNASTYNATGNVSTLSNSSSTGNVTNTTTIINPLNDTILPVNNLGTKGDAYLASLGQAYNASSNATTNFSATASGPSQPLPTDKAPISQQKDEIQKRDHKEDQIRSACTTECLILQGLDNYVTRKTKSGQSWGVSNALGCMAQPDDGDIVGCNNANF